MEENKPVKNFKSNGITATIWKKVVVKDNISYDMYNVEIVKNYPKTKDKTGKVTEWSKTASYNKDDLMNVQVVLNEAVKFLYLKEE